MNLFHTTKTFRFFTSAWLIYQKQSKHKPPEKSRATPAMTVEGAHLGTTTIRQDVPTRSAGFQTCCIADFQVGRVLENARPAGLETRDTADLEVCATMAVPRCAPSPVTCHLSPVVQPPIKTSCQ